MRIALPPNTDRSPFFRFPALLLAVFAVFAACSGNNNTSSTPVPLPNGQSGSLSASNSGTDDCYAMTTSSSSISSCSTPDLGTYGGVTALSTAMTGSPSVPTLIVGTSNGTVAAISSTASTSPTFTACPLSTTVPGSIAAVAAAAGTSTVNVFAASGDTLYENSSGSTACSTTSTTTSTATISGTTSPITGLAVTSGTLIGVTSNGYYFTTPATSLSGNPIPASPLPNYPVNGPVITAMTVDANGIVFFADASTNTNNNGGQVTLYTYSSTSGLTYNGQSLSGNNNGVAISDPIGIAVSTTNITNPNYCGTAPCDYIYLLNNGNVIQQYVFQVPNPVTGGVSIQPFNLPYTGCEMTTPAAIASFPSLTSTSPQAGPLVFLGNNGQANYCSGSTSSYGNDVTSYTIKGQ